MPRFGPTHRHCEEHEASRTDGVVEFASCIGAGRRWPHGTPLSLVTGPAIMLPRKLLARFDDLSVRNKILAGYAALVMPFLALLIMAGLLSTQILAISRQINDNSVPALERLERVRNSGVSVIEATNTFALMWALEDNATADAMDKADRLREVENARDDFSRAVREFQGLADTDGGGDQTFRHNIAFAHNDILVQSDRIARLAAARASTAVLFELRDRFERSATNFRILVQTAIEAEKFELTSRQTEMNRLIWLSAVVVTGFGVVGIAAAVLGGLRVSERIAHPIRRLRDAALRIGDGDFDVANQRRTGDEVGELVEAFHTMVQRLRDSMVKLARQERLATLGQLAGTVSHELRNPLGAIRNSLFSLRESVEGSGAGCAKALDRIERNIGRCDSIVSELLNYARCGEIRRAEVDVDCWIAGVLDEHAIPNGISLWRELGFGDAIPFDRERFRQVLVNLLDNAIQAINDPAWQGTEPKENCITVRTESAGPFFQLSVSDTGPGIPAPTQSEIFEPLFTTKSFGVGLGLPMVRQIVQQHGGSIDVTSSVGKGAAFIILLPRTVQQQDKAA
jgi:signal transduction histidine kinase